ncbi:pikachurin [Apis mellifera caucasica]|nr:pikachurin [Apis mellifera caucasica]
MAEFRVYRFFVILVHLAVVLVLAQNPIEEKTTFEAAFQGRCGHGSPCEQLCYELHDGMYECDCKDGYILHKNGYSCAELNSTSPSTGELGELVEDVENDELNKDTDDEDAVEDILYMRGASFTIHLDPPPENSTTNSSKIIEETSPPVDRVELRATSQGPNLEQKLPSTMESIVSTEPACSLDCGPAGNCYIEQSHGDDVDLIADDDDDDDDDDADDDETGGGDTSMAVDLEGNDVAPRRKQGSFRQRCQCPLGRGGDRCQLGDSLLSVISRVQI